MNYKYFICPICDRPLSSSKYDEKELKKYFPFCSKKCKLIDLGCWLDTDYRVPVDLQQQVEY